MTCSRVFRSKAPRPGTSPAVCRGWRNCSRRAVRRTTRSSPRSTARSSSAATTRTSAASTSCREDEAAEAVEYLIPKGKHLPGPGRRLHREGRVHPRRQPGAARHPGHQGRRGAGRLPRQRDPGGLPPAGRADQRQAHRGDRPPDAAEGRDHRSGRHRPCSRASSSTSSNSTRSTTSSIADGMKPAYGVPVLLGITKASLQTRRSSRRRPSRKPPASSPRRRFPARSTRSKASRRTSSSAASSRPAPAA